MDLYDKMIDGLEEQNANIQALLDSALKENRCLEEKVTILEKELRTPSSSFSSSAYLPDNRKERKMCFYEHFSEGSWADGRYVICGPNGSVDFDKEIHFELPNKPYGFNQTRYSDSCCFDKTLLRVKLPKLSSGYTYSQDVEHILVRRAELITGSLTASEVSGQSSNRCLRAWFFYDDDDNKRNTKTNEKNWQGPLELEIPLMFGPSLDEGDGWCSASIENIFGWRVRIELECFSDLLSNVSKEEVGKNWEDVLRNSEDGGAVKAVLRVHCNLRGKERCVCKSEQESHRALILKNGRSDDFYMVPGSKEMVCSLDIESALHPGYSCLLFRVIDNVTLNPLHFDHGSLCCTERREKSSDMISHSTHDFPFNEVLDNWKKFNVTNPGGGWCFLPLIHLFSQSELSESSYQPLVSIIYPPFGNFNNMGKEKTQTHFEFELRLHLKEPSSTKMDVVVQVFTMNYISVGFKKFYPYVIDV